MSSRVLLLFLLVPPTVRSFPHEYCYRFIGRPPPRIGAYFSCVLRSSEDDLSHGGLHLKESDPLSCSDDDDAILNRGWRTPCAQATLNVSRAKWNISTATWPDCGFEFELPKEPGINHSLQCFYDYFTGRFYGIVDDREFVPDNAWKESVLSVRVPTEYNCAWLQLYPGKCDGPVEPPDLTVEEELDDASFWNQRNDAINRRSPCPLEDLWNFSLVDENAILRESEVVTIQFALDDIRCSKSVVESIPLEGHRVGYGVLPVEPFAAAAEETVVAQRRGDDEVCFGYDFMESTDITEGHFSMCKNICVEIDGDPGYIERRRNAVFAGGLCERSKSRLKVWATSGAVFPDTDGTWDARTDSTSCGFAALPIGVYPAIAAVAAAVMVSEVGVLS